MDVSPAILSRCGCIHGILSENAPRAPRPRAGHDSALHTGPTWLSSMEGHQSNEDSLFLFKHLIG